MTSTQVAITDKHQTVRFGLNEMTQYTRSSSSTGSGGWQVVDRPRNRVATEWTDVGQYQLTVNLIMGGTDFTSNPPSIETRIAVVEGWEEPATGSTPPQPPTLRISGPVPHTELDWVLSSLTWGDCYRDAGSGARYYQELQMVLWEFIPPAVIKTRKSPAKDAKAQIVGSSTATTKRYTVKAGDTLRSIAAAHYGDWMQWSNIAAANGLRSSTSVSAGQIITLP